MKIAMISLNDDTYQPLADITYHKSKLLYCERHGYESIVKTDNFFFSDPKMLGFEKIKMILDVFEDKPYLDWIHWTGADVMVTNFNVRLENIIDDDYHVVVCFDGNGMNVDSMLIKNSRVGRGLMQWVLDNVDKYKNHYWYEQQAMIDFYFQVPLAKDIIKALPQRVMNSYIYDLYPEWRGRPHIDHTGHDGDWQEGDFMIQLPGLPIQQRIDVMEQILKKIVK
jgi:hypothetical protein